MKDIAPMLKSLGLLESEVKVYLAALELGPSTVIEIAKSTRLSRPATYTAIGTLSGRGLMSTVQKGKRRIFASEHPDRLLLYAQRKERELEERVRDLERALPELSLRIGGEKPIVKSFEGKEGLHAIIEDYRQTRPRTIEEITNIDAMLTVLTPEDLLPMRKELRALGTKIRGLYTGKAIAPSSIGADTRVLPAQFSNFHGNMSIYGNKIAFVTFTGKLHSVIVENEELARTLRALFEIAWQTAKEFPSPKSPAPSA